MNIEKRKLGKKTKYYLAESIRVHGKVKKIRVYLGTNNKEVKQQIEKAKQILNERKKIYGKISDPLKTVLTSKELEELKSLEARGEIKTTHLTEDDWRLFTEVFTYDTNAIEGSTVTYNEVKEIIEKNQWPRERKKWEISETYGVAEAINYIRKTKEHISLDLIKEIHKIVFRNSKNFAGEFRTKGQEIAVMDGFGNIVHRGALSTLIPNLLKELVEWYNKNKTKYPPILLASIVHNQFENIHPFADGNGRVGRILLNNILLKHNKPPINIELKNRSEYYHALREYQNNKNIRPTIEFILKEYKNLKKIINK